MESIKRFEHDLLDLSKDQIRLLRILPRSTTTIQCTLETFDRDTSPPYEALSYAWGPKNYADILLNGALYAIRQNLWDFLDRASEKSITRADGSDTYEAGYLWIDQICIDQLSTQEKNQQVSRMSNTFEHATRVVIWLGRGTDGTDCRVPVTFVDMKLAQQPYYEKGRLIYSPPSIAEIEVFDMLFSQPYWTRLWIIQEIVLAKTLLICLGQHHLGWDELYDYSSAHVLIRGTPSMIFPAQHALIGRKAVPSLIRDRYWHGQGVGHYTKYDWRNLLPEYGTLDCEQPHDKVYSLNALAGPPSRVTVDYTKPASHLFWDVMDLTMRAGWADESYNKWIIPLGLLMGVDGTESNAIMFSNAHYVLPGLKFSWPQGFQQLGENEVAVPRVCTLTLEARSE